MSLLSILVPTRNRRTYLKSCLDSLLATTVPCEILVSDNASDDGTEQMLAACDDPRLRRFRQPADLGAMANHNFLLAHARGDFLCLFGDDDVALPGCFERKVAILQADASLGGIFSRTRIMDAAGTILPAPAPFGLVDYSHLEGRDMAPHLLLNCLISWQTLVFRRDVAEQLGPLSDSGPWHFATDWDYLYRLSRLTRLAYLNEPTVAVRLHAGSGGNRAAQESGAYAEDMLHFWRRHLIEDPQPPLIDRSAWHQMWRLLKGAVLECYPQDGATRLDAFAARFEALGDAYEIARERVFAERLPEPAADVERDSDGRPRFRPGLIPPLDTAPECVRFLHHADWRQDSWRTVVHQYLQAFNHGDPVELLICGEPVADPSPDRVAATLAALLAAKDGPGGHPAVTLQIAPLPLDTLIAGYGHADVVVPAGDPTQVRRAVQLDLAVLLDGDPLHWRQAARRFSVFAGR